MAKEFKPGEIVPQSGVDRIIHDPPHADMPHEVTVIKGRGFPTCRHCKDIRFAIITTTPNELCANLHNRMPVVLKPEAWPVWLAEQPADLLQLKSLLGPYPSDEVICRR